MALPTFREDGWLPEGHHTATWQEVALRFAGQPDSPRAVILSSLLKWRDAVRASGMAGLVILDGSFISSKETPGDFDLVFLYDEATEALVRNDAIRAEANRLSSLPRPRISGRYFCVACVPAKVFTDVERVGDV